VRVIADDLTGAADSGVAFRRLGAEVVVAVDHGGRKDHCGRTARGVTVVDTDTREASAARAYTALHMLGARIGGHELVFKKIDSLLRGPIAAELAALRRAQPERLVVVAPAVPALGRVTRSGAVEVDPPAVAATLAPSSGPARVIAKVLGRGPVHGVGLPVVRSGPDTLASVLRTAAAAGAMAVCDAAADEDLDRIVAAGSALGAPVLWVGAAGLAAALARALPGLPGEQAREQADPPPAATPLLIVGSHSPVALDQARILAAHGARWIRFDARHLLAMSAREHDWHGAALLHRAPGVATVVSVTGQVDGRAGPAVAAALGQVCAIAVASARLAVISGGTTARAVLVRAGVTSLTLLGEIEPGTVLARAAGPRRPLHVITKAGSFSDSAALLRLVTRMQRGAG